MKTLLLTTLFGLFATTVFADTASLPYSLDIANPVQLSGSDDQSKAFNEYLDSYNKTGNKDFTVTHGMMTMTQDSNIRAYFVSEDAGYKNTLGISSLGPVILTPDAKLIFPNASSDSSVRTKDSPLLPGDFVDLGLYKKGTTLDFFLVANGFNGGKQLFSTTQSLNSDGLIHSIALNNNGSPYQLIAFEDILGGGDRDFNDCVFAFEVKSAIIEPHGLAAPEPSLLFGSSFMCVLLLSHRKR